MTPNIAQAIVLEVLDKIARCEWEMTSTDDDVRVTLHPTDEPRTFEDFNLILDPDGVIRHP